MVRPCPICNNTYVDFLFYQNFHTDTIIPFKDYYVVCCNNCGMIYANVQKTQKKLDEYYQNLNKYEFGDKRGKVPQSYIDHFYKIYNFIEPYLKNKNIKILDIGCSTGALLNVFKENGYNRVFGIDPSESCCNFARKEYKIEVHSYNIFELENENEFDLIILSAVLEHIIDVRNFIKKIKELLKKDGLLFISIPDANRFSNNIQNPFQQFSSEHLNYFNDYYLSKLCISLKNEFLWLKSKAYEENKTTKVSDPELFLLYNLSSGISDIRDINAINTYHKLIRYYIQKSYQLEFELKEKLQRKLKNINQFIVWGVGVSTLRLLNNGIDINKVLFFVDSNKHYQNKKILDRTIVSPESIEKNSDFPIFILSYAYVQEIVEQIKDMNLKNEVITIYD